VSFTVISPLVWFGEAVSFFQKDHLALGLLALLMAVSSFIVGLWLLQRDPSAIKLAKAYLLVNIVVSVIISFAGTPGSLDDPHVLGLAIGQSIAVLVVGSIVTAIWWLYLNKSVRVKNTYGVVAAKSNVGSVPFPTSQSQRPVAAGEAEKLQTTSPLVPKSVVSVGNKKWVGITIGVAALVLGGLIICLPQLRKVRQVRAREELAKINISYDSKSFLHSAAKGDILAVQLFLDAGMNPNLSNEGTGPLGAAAYNGQTEMVRFLLGKGAKVDLQDSCGETPFIKATEGEKDTTQVMELLLKEGADTGGVPSCSLSMYPGGNTLIRAAGVFRVNVNNVRFLLDNGADVNTHDGYNTPLNYAIHTDNLELVKLLLDRGAKVEGADILDAKGIARNPEMLRLFREAVSKDPTFWSECKRKYNPAALGLIKEALGSVERLEFEKLFQKIK
jgi:hypothetical protein